MTIEAKTILKDKFWIVEDKENKKRIGTICWDEDRYMFTDGSETCFFNNKKQIKKKFGVDIIWSDVAQIPSTTQEHFVHGFPTSVAPYNTVYDLKRKLPLFTKSDKSKSLYCAGYYIIKFDKGWVKSFCPKLITVERYETRGPFKTDLEMRQELSRVNN